MHKLSKDKIRSSPDHYPDRYFCIHWQDTEGLSDLNTQKEKKYSQDPSKTHAI